MGFWRKAAGLLAAGAIALTAGGCMALDGSDLLTLPRLSPEHKQLLSLISEKTSQNWAPTAPQSGQNRYTMQFVDFFGDGIPEAVVFFRNAKELSVRVTIYNKTGEGSYSHMTDILTDGYMVDAISYGDLDGDGSVEIILKTVYESGSVRGLEVFSLKNNAAEAVLKETCTTALLSDLDGDGLSELLLIRSDASPENAYAELFKYRKDSDRGAGKMISLGRAAITPSEKEPEKITEGKVSGSVRGVFVDSIRADSQDSDLYATDVLYYSESTGLFNISYNPSHLASNDTTRTFDLMCLDVDFDGYVEIPMRAGSASALLQNNGAPQTPSFVQWHVYDGEGDMVLKTLTYISEGRKWYFLLPASWWSSVSVFAQASAEGDYTTVFFKSVVSGDAHDLFYLHSAPAAAVADGSAKFPAAAFELAAEGGTVYYGELPGSGVPDGMALAGRAEAAQRFVILDAFGGVRRSYSAGSP